MNTPDKPKAGLLIAIGEKKDSPMMDNNYNRIEISDDMLQGMQEGQEVDATIHGKIVVKPDGSRCIDVSEVDGQPIGKEEESAEEEDAETPEEEASEPMDDMESAKNNLMNSIRNQGGYSNASDEE